MNKRKSIRLPEYDYTEPGGYFITIVARDRQHLFGEIEHGKMHLNHFGVIAEKEWFRTADLRPMVELFVEEFVVMPDHVHGIIWIREQNDIPVGAERRSALIIKPKRVERRFQGRKASAGHFVPAPTEKTDQPRSITTKPPQPSSLGVIIRAYKSAVAYRINQVRNTVGSPIWQRNYYEHIIRDEKDLDEICAYIEGNPACWEMDDPFQPPIHRNTQRIISIPK